MIDEVKHRHGVHRYRNVTDGVAMANEYLSSRLSVSEFARQKSVSFKMVKYWCARARQLAAAANAKEFLGDIRQSALHMVVSGLPDLGSTEVHHLRFDVNADHWRGGPASCRQSEGAVATAGVDHRPIKLGEPEGIEFNCGIKEGCPSVLDWAYRYPRANNPGPCPTDVASTRSASTRWAGTATAAPRLEIPLCI